jgi:hypothetical protein
MRGIWKPPEIILIKNMNIESLEIKLLKASEIVEGDVILVKVSEKNKSKLTKEKVQSLYQQIIKIINKKNIPIYFFPDDVEMKVIKNHIQNVELQKEKIEENIEDEN